MFKLTTDSLNVHTSTFNYNVIRFKNLYKFSSDNRTLERHTPLPPIPSTPKEKGESNEQEPDKYEGDAFFMTQVNRLSASGRPFKRSFSLCIILRMCCKPFYRIVAGLGGGYA